MKGVTYNYNVCSPEEIKYCNICGEDIRYCEHVEGWEYGGEICHMSGVIYAEKICLIRIADVLM